jgi:acyl dehydratase
MKPNSARTEKGFHDVTVETEKERNAMQTIKFDDIAALTAKIGKEFGPWSEPIHVTQEKIGGPVAHGFLTLSLLPAFKTKDEYTVTGFRNVVNYGANKLRFVAPVPAGASVYSRSRLVAVEPRPMGTMLTRETEIQVVGAQKPAVVYEALMLFVK